MAAAVSISCPSDGSVGMSAKCPICRAPVVHDFRPFCSRRCTDVDLNRWFTGVYSVPVVDLDDEDLDRLMAGEAGGGNTDGEEAGD